MGFKSGSNNTVISGNGAASFLSGSNNTIIGNVGSLGFGSGNTYIGTGGPNVLESNTLRIGNYAGEIMKNNDNLTFNFFSGTYKMKKN